MAAWKDRAQSDTICLFDVDGTLTPARQFISPEMVDTIKKLRAKCVVGFVGGSDLVKQEEQLGKEGIELFDFAFAENGLNAFKSGKLLATQSFIGWIGEEKYQRLANYILRYIADLKLPQKRGTFIEFRNGMINVSPIGRNCSKSERDEFEKYDHVHKIRSSMVDALKREFPDFGLTYSVGGQISFDVFPAGHLTGEGFKTIHFFGDKTYQGGNDYEIYTHPDVKGHSVKNPEETIAILKELFGI